ncbi:365_t:CDS:2, partial [Gigaspora rosea]
NQIKEKTEEASNLTHNKAQTYLNTKEILSLKECGTMDYAAIAIGTRRHNNIHNKKDTLRGSLSDKTNIGSSTQWKMGVEEQGFSIFTREKRPQPGSRSSSKECSKPSKSFNLGLKPKHVDKENISQTNLLQEILERLN